MKIVKTATLTALVSSLTLLGATAHADTPPLPTFPAMSGPLVANAKPYNYYGPVGHVYVTGVVSGIAQAQSNTASGIAKSQTDVSNAQVFLNKTDGLIQFSAQFGSYSIPALGAAYLKAEKLSEQLYGTFPQGFVKLVPSDSFNLMVGKLPTLIGSEYTFTFQNMNIQRGLLWGQEPAVSRGVQANFTAGPVAVSGSFNDGYYSNNYDAVSLATTYTLNSSNIFVVSGSANVGSRSSESTFATPPSQNNGQIYNLIYTNISGPLTITPYLQYSTAPDLSSLGLSTKKTNTLGAAVLASYKLNDTFSLPVRAEYIRSSGSATDGSANLLGFGAGSEAWSFTITPTYQDKAFFARAEVSYVGVDSEPFGKNADKKGQVTGLIETGIVF
jgi:Putative beta-barrel porin-2, OmpL-like. bbp2